MVEIALGVVVGVLGAVGLVVMLSFVAFIIATWWGLV